MPQSETTTPEHGESTRALVQTLALAALAASVSAVVNIFVFAGLGSASGVTLPWLAVALGFVVAEIFVFHIEIRHEAIGFSLSDIPLALGLFFLPPVTLVLVRTFASLAVLAVHERQSPRKLALNFASFLAESTAAITVFWYVSLSQDPKSSFAWLATLMAIASAQAVSYGLISLAMKWHGAVLKLRTILLAISVTTSTNTALASLAAVLVVTSPVALFLLLFVTLFVVLAYRAYNRLNRRYSSLQLLYQFTRLVSGSREPDAVIDAMLHEARRLARAQHAALVLDDGTSRIVRWVCADDQESDHPRPELDDLRPFVTENRAMVVPRGANHERGRTLLTMLDAKDAMIAPVHEDDVLVGAIVVLDRNTDVSTFDKEDGRLFETLANHAGIALQNGRLIERLRLQTLEREHDSMHDPLTGLPNRAKFIRQLSDAVATSALPGAAGNIAVALLDLDHFREINDTLGHQTGDILIGDVAQRLRKGLAPEVVVARLGGDEFAFIAAFEGDEKVAHEFAQSIQAILRAPFHLHGLALEVMGSIGVAVSPEHGIEPSTLLQRADVAMYVAKASSPDRVGVYRPESDTNTPRRLALANDLRAAIEAGDLDLHYQPKASLADGRVHSAEGLVRWRHPVYGNVPPNEFVPLAERTGLIKPFTQFVIERGLQTLGEWHETGLDLGLSLNLSARNLLDDELPQRVADALSRSKVPANRVTFEITETSMMDDPDKAIHNLHALAKLDVRLSIDDFGTGQSSLSYIQRLPVHEVKIDRSFIVPLVATWESRSIVNSIVQLGHSLGLNVVAEGVEDAATLDIVTGLDCDDVQGYFLSRPIPDAEFRAWVQRRQASPLTIAV